MLLGWEWWQFCILALLLFLGCLFANYVLKKFNEAKIEERFARLLQKSSKSQSTQIQEMALAIESNKLKPVPILSSAERNMKKTPGISLVFNKEENIYHDNNGKMYREIVTKTLVKDENRDKSQKPKETLLQKLSGTSLKKYLHQKNDNMTTKCPGSIVIKDSKVILPIREISQNTKPTLLNETSDNTFKIQVLEINEETSRNLSSVSNKDSGKVCNASDFEQKIIDISQNTPNQVTNDILEVNENTTRKFNSITIKDSVKACNASNSEQKTTRISQHRVTLHQETNDISSEKIKLEPKETTNSGARIKDTTIIIPPINYEEPKPEVSQKSILKNVHIEPKETDIKETLDNNIFPKKSSINIKQTCEQTYKTLFNITDHISSVKIRETSLIDNNNSGIINVASKAYLTSSGQEISVISDNTEESVYNSNDFEQSATSTSTLKKEKSKDCNSISIALPNIKIDDLPSEITNTKDNLQIIVMDKAVAQKKTLKNTSTKHINSASVESSEDVQK